MMREQTEPLINTLVQGIMSENGSAQIRYEVKDQESMQNFAKPLAQKGELIEGLLITTATSTRIPLFVVT